MMWDLPEGPVIPGRTQSSSFPVPQTQQDTRPRLNSFTYATQPYVINPLAAQGRPTLAPPQVTLTANSDHYLTPGTPGFSIPPPSHPTHHRSHSDTLHARPSTPHPNPATAGRSRERDRSHQRHHHHSSQSRDRDRSHHDKGHSSRSRSRDRGHHDRSHRSSSRDRSHHEKSHRSRSQERSLHDKSHRNHSRGRDYAHKERKEPKDHARKIVIHHSNHRVHHSSSHNKLTKQSNTHHHHHNHSTNVLAPPQVTQTYSAPAMTQHHQILHVPQGATVTSGPVVLQNGHHVVNHSMPQPQAAHYHSTTSAPPMGSASHHYLQQYPQAGPYPNKLSPVPPMGNLSHHPRPQPQFDTPAPLEHEFQYSRCTGRKKALCIGINYTGSEHQLNGCINDARNMMNGLINHFGYKAEDIVLLTDDSRNPRRLPTRKNIIGGMKWLVTGARPHDALAFHYSGHGGQTPDLDGDEVDGFDEVIFPLDFKQAGHIVDDEMNEIMVKALPTGCRLTAIFDSCHSGTVLDLPYIYSSHGRLKGSHITAKAIRDKATSADVISLSGCKDDQTSADTFSGGVAVGAMSHAFITSLRTKPNQSYQQLLSSIRHILYPKYNQKPQLGSSHPIDTKRRFIM